MQPPSGGCVLKHSLPVSFFKDFLAAAFGRLCVETRNPDVAWVQSWAAAFGRLCVETELAKKNFNFKINSRLRAAVC